MNLTTPRAARRQGLDVPMEEEAGRARLAIQQCLHRLP